MVPPLISKVPAGTYTPTLPPVNVPSVIFKAVPLEKFSPLAEPFVETAALCAAVIVPPLISTLAVSKAVIP